MEQQGHRLSSIDLLPEQASGLVQWAILALEKGDRTDSDILFEFNDQLEVMGIEKISRSAFGRYALKKRKVFGERAEFHALSSAFAKEYGSKSTSELTLTLGQMMMTAMYKHLARKDATPKEISDMSRAMQALNSAQRIAVQEKRTDDEAARKAAEEEAKAERAAMVNSLETAIKTSGIAGGKELIRRVREEFYDIYDEPSEMPPAPLSEAAP
jgi:Protein of unknown function (DUF3486)